MVADVGGMTRAPKEHIVQWLHTPTTYGGYGYISGRDGGISRTFRRVKEVGRDEWLRTNKYEDWTEPKANWDELGALGRVQLQRKGEAFKLSTNGVRGLAGLLVPKKAEGSTMTVFEEVDREGLQGSGMGSRGWGMPGDFLAPGYGRTLPSPRYKMDAMIARAALTSVDDEEEALGYLEPDELVRARNYRVELPRRTWWEWMKGTLETVSVNWFGAAGDVRGHVAKQVASLGLLPFGKVRVGSMVRRRFALERAGLRIATTYMMLGP